MRYLKKIKYLIMMLVFISFSYSIEFDISEKQIKDGIVYRRGEKNSFTGVFLGKNIREEYKKGVRNGKYIGMIKIEENEYICEGEFVEGIKNGDWFIKFPNGKIHAILKYNYDLPAGQWTYFYPNNRVKGYENFENGIISGEVTVYRDNGDLLKKLEYKNGLVDGEMIIYSKNKVLDSIVNFSMGKLDGKIAIYSNNNILQLDGKYKNDKRESLWRLYYNNGNLKMVVAYNHGLKNGRMIVYNKEGQVVQSTIYKENNEVDEKGNIIEKTDDKGDTKDNILIKFKNVSYDLEYIKYNEVLSNL